MNSLYVYRCVLYVRTPKDVSTFCACYLHFFRLLTNTYTIHLFFAVRVGINICLAYSVSGAHTMAQNKSRGFSNIRGYC